MQSIKERLSEGQIVRVMFQGAFASPKLVEATARFADVHAIWFDQEHSGLTHPQLELLLLAGRAAGLDTFVRVAPTDYGTIMRPMEAGAGGIMAAQIRTVEQVQQIVQWAKYPPQGVRGLFRGNVEAGFGSADLNQHVEQANRQRWLAIQIETPEAVDAVEAIVAVDGVDCLFVGPGDLACTLGVPGQPMHPRCIAALEKVSTAVREAGKAWGALTLGAEHAARCRQLGCQLFSLISDTDLVRRGCEALKQTYGDFY